MSHYKDFRTDYKCCPLCGAILDCGEKCDCIETTSDNNKADTTGASEHKDFAKAAVVNLISACISS